MVPDGSIGFGVPRAEPAIDPVHGPDRRITSKRPVEHDTDFEDPLLFRRQRVFVVQTFTAFMVPILPNRALGVQAFIIP